MEPIRICIWASEHNKKNGLVVPIEAAFSQLSAERSFASLSLREVSREAGIAPTSFYRHFRDVDELGLTMVDESGLMLRQLMRLRANASPRAAA